MKVRVPSRNEGRRAMVEVVIPCYNYGQFLPACVESVLQQPGVEARVTIVDDLSTDGSVEVARRLAEMHAQVRLIENPVNLGAWRTFNTGLKQVDSDYVVLISADDALAPGSLRRAAAFMDTFPRVGLVYGHAQKFTSSPVLKRAMPAVSWTTWNGDDWVSLQLRRSWLNIASPEAMVRTSVQHDVGYYDPNLRHTADVEMWLRIGSISDVGHINGIDQAYYRRQPTSMSAGFSMYVDIEERWRAFDKFLTSWAKQEVAARLRPVVRRRLANEALFDLMLQLDAGEASRDTATTALGVARTIDPEIVVTGRWTDAIRLSQNQSLAKSPATVGRTALRKLARLSRWHSWHRFRYLG